MLNTAFPPWPSYTEEEASAVSKVLLSNRVNYWTGDECRAFERDFATWCDAKYAIALANGTVALDLALKTLGIGEGDEVIVTSRTFIASASCIAMAGARPVFADVDRDSQNVTAETIAAVLTPKTKAIVCVHLAGWPCDMDPIMALAECHGLYVIEDCAQAHGARYKGRSVGSIGHVGAWSFCQDKIITTGGEGGMLTLSREDWWKKAWAYKDHGKSWNAVFQQAHPPGFRWLHESFGSNWRMTEIQACIGRIQLSRMPEWHHRRARHARVLSERFSTSCALRVPQPKAGVEHAWYKFYAFVRPELLREGWSRDRIMAEVNVAGVPCYSGTCSEVYLEKAFDLHGFHPKVRLHNAQELGETSLMFLVHPTLGDADIDLVATVVERVLAEATSIC